MILLESIHHISMGSADLARTVAFYEGILDFELVEQSDAHVILYLDPIALRFNLVDDYEGRNAHPRESALAFILDVDDFTNAINDLEESEIEILEGPIAIEGGESLLIQDPDGHFLELFYRE
ncbi:MAG: VOC family protein [Leptospiraceae bacterium]|nr:VOC family protein [Leptospiraceae bacterium]